MARPATRSYSEISLRTELREQHRRLLPAFAVALLAIDWAWYTIGVSEGQYAHVAGGITPNDVVIALLALGAGLVLWLRRRHFVPVCYAHLFIVFLCEYLIRHSLPVYASVTVRMLTIFLVNIVLGTGQGFLSATLVWGLGVAHHLLAPAESASLGYLTGMYGMYCALSLMVWLSNRTWETSIMWAFSGWARARDMLAETRQRRAELYRAVRALDEATYRIERMNSELIVARHEAEVAKHNKARFAAIVSHELRGSLNVILGFSRLMALSPERYSAPLPSAYRADISTVYSNSQHLVALLDDILDLSQIEAEGLPVLREPIDLEQDVVSEVVDSLRPLVERKGLSLRLELEDNLPSVLADKVRLRQVFVNLLVNAIRHTDRGTISVRASMHEDALLVSVEDTGSGISPEKISHLFEEFSQFSTATGEGVRSTGLGLPISKQLIQLHGGRMWAESRQGQGTTFYFSLPFTGNAKDGWGQTISAGSGPTPRATGTCLIVHSDLDVIRLLARHIKGHRCIGLPDETEVAAIVDELHPRAVITCPERSHSIWRRLSEASSEVPLITCNLPESSSRTDFQGTLTYLLKPVIPEMIRAVVGRVEREDDTTVLLVDDDPDAVRLLEAILTSLPRPYTILKAYDGGQALEIMQRVIPDLVLLDLLMPGVDGYQTIAQMRVDPRLRRVPVAVITAGDPSHRSFVLGTTIAVRCQRPLEMHEGVECLQGLLNALRPNYLPGPDGPELLGQAPPERSAS